MCFSSRGSAFVHAFRKKDFLSLDLRVSKVSSHSSATDCLEHSMLFCRKISEELCLVCSRKMREKKNRKVNNSRKTDVSSLYIAIVYCMHLCIYFFILGRFHE